MFRTLTLSAALAALVAGPAMAQTMAVPGSETAVEQHDFQDRQNVAIGIAAEPDRQNPTADATTETIIPGNTSEIDLNLAAERDAVAAGTDANVSARSELGTPTGPSPIVPGSGATFDARVAQSGSQAPVVQDEAPTLN